ncbi:MAG: thrombospondin type 3 repeat-containing protein [bacterium]
MMKSRHNVLKTALLAVSLQATILVHAFTPDVASRWNDGTTEGWSAVNATLAPYPVSNPDTYLRVSFSDRSQGGMPGMAIVKADANTAQGRFVGNYKSGGITRISFQIFCSNRLPEQARLVLHSPSSGSYWYYHLEVTEIGKWVWIDVPLDYSAGWTRDTNPLEESFNADLEDVDMVGVWIFQNQTAAQNYGLDNFVLATPRYDDDGDGMSDIAEIRAGTNPHDALSVFKLSMASTGDGITIAWPSKPGLYYNVWRSMDMKAGWMPLATEWPADSFADFTVYLDTTATDRGPYFYRVTPR